MHQRQTPREPHLKLHHHRQQLTRGGARATILRTCWGSAPLQRLARRQFLPHPAGGGACLTCLEGGGMEKERGGGHRDSRCLRMGHQAEMQRRGWVLPHQQQLGMESFWMLRREAGSRSGVGLRRMRGGFLTTCTWRIGVGGRFRDLRYRCRATLKIQTPTPKP